MPEIITRKEAIACGLKRYFTGKPCKHGHVCERTVDGQCLECNRVRRIENKDKQNERARRRYRRLWSENPEGMREYLRQKAKGKDPDKRRETERRWRQANIEKLRKQGRDRERQRRAENPDKAREREQKYRHRARAKDPVAYAEKQYEINRAYRLTNYRKIKKRQIEWLEKNPHKKKEYQQRGYEKNRDKILARGRQRYHEQIDREKQRALEKRKKERAAILLLRELVGNEKAKKLIRDLTT